MIASGALDRTVRLARDAVCDDVSDETIVHRLQSFRVRCVADENNVNTPGGQASLVTLVSLIARMGVQVTLEVPDVGLIGPQPPLRGTRLRTALVDFGSDCVPGTSVTHSDPAPCDLTFVIGDSPFAVGSAVTWRLTGNAWAGAISPTTTTAQALAAKWPIGGMTAAALAVPEVFKAVIRSLPLRGAQWHEYLAPCGRAEFDFGEEGIVPPDGEPMHVDVISAGAITQAALFILFRLPLQLVLRLFDDDLAELSNINRQMLFRRSDTGLKVDIITHCAPSSFRCTPIPMRFSLTGAASYLPLAEHVLVGVDTIPARWDVQHAAKRWLGVAATSHFGVSTSSHEPLQPCAGCLHPTDDPDIGSLLPTVSFVSFWAGLSLAVRFLRQLAQRPYNRQQQQLWLSPLRMDQRHAAWWSPIAARRDCPVRCVTSSRQTQGLVSAATK